MDWVLEAVVEHLDIKQLASNAKELEVDDAVDVLEDLEESDKEVFLDKELFKKAIRKRLRMSDSKLGIFNIRKSLKIFRVDEKF